MSAGIDFRKPQLCDHGLGDDVDIQAVSIIDGKLAKVRVYHYFCHQHDRFGIFSVKESKVSTAP